MTEHHPIRAEARRVRPPYDRPEPAMEQDVMRGEPTDTWRQRVHTDRLAALDEQAPADLTAHERQHLVWMAGWDDNTVAITASLLHRARSEGRRQGVAEATEQNAAWLREKADTAKDTEKPATVLRRLAATLDRRARKRRD